MKKLLFTGMIALSLVFFSSGKCIDKKTAGEKGEIYVCLPCGSSCDTVSHTSPGTCSQCNMELVRKSSVKHTDVSPDGLCSFVNKEGRANVLLLDVRTPAEFNGKAEQKYGRLNNAVNIPIQDLEARIGELQAWKDKQIVVYCSHSHRSPRASYMLSQKGFTKVTNMSGGMSVWKASVKESACNQQLFISQ
ncbi:MAG: rhodanese-like domain-containing protein [Chitinophagaceae bacterium]|nr:rhodanese-like domain-containing protein [Chitinophagaceae bacterium]